MSIYRPLTGLELADIWMIASACYEAASADDVAARGSALGRSEKIARKAAGAALIREISEQDRP